MYGASPDASFSKRALGRTDMTVYMNTSLNTGHACGLARGETIILPVLARDEEPEPSTQESMFSYVRLFDGERQGMSRLLTMVHEVKLKSSLSWDVEYWNQWADKLARNGRIPAQSARQLVV